MLLIEFLSDKVQFWKPYQANQSFIVFSSNLSEKHVIQKLQSVNPIKLAATKIRKSLINLLLILKTNFVMQQQKKKNSLDNAYILHEPIYFFSKFFNIPQSYLCSYQVDLYNIVDDNDGLDFAKSKVMKINTKFHITAYRAKRKKDHSIYLLPTVYTRGTKVDKF